VVIVGGELSVTFLGMYLSMGGWMVGMESEVEMVVVGVRDVGVGL